MSVLRTQGWQEKCWRDRKRPQAQMSYKKNELQWMRLGESEAIKCICRAKMHGGR